MLIYTIINYYYGDVTLELATIDRNEALEEFKKDPRKEGHYYSLQVWKDGKELMDIYFSDQVGTYRAYPTNIDEDDEMIKEIINQLK